MQPASLALAFLALLGVLALILLAGRVARVTRLGPRLAGAGRLGVVQVVALDGRRKLHLVRCDDQHLILLTGGASDVIAGWLPARPPAGGAEP